MNRSTNCSISVSFPRTGGQGLPFGATSPSAVRISPDRSASAARPATRPFTMNKRRKAARQDIRESLDVCIASDRPILERSPWSTPLPADAGRSAGSADRHRPRRQGSGLLSALSPPVAFLPADQKNFVHLLRGYQSRAYRELLLKTQGERHQNAAVAPHRPLPPVHEKPHSKIDQRGRFRLHPRR